MATAVDRLELRRQTQRRILRRKQRGEEVQPHRGIRRQTGEAPCHEAGVRHTRPWEGSLQRRVRDAHCRSGGQAAPWEALRGGRTRSVSPPLCAELSSAPPHGDSSSWSLIGCLDPLVLPLGCIHRRNRGSAPPSIPGNTQAVSYETSFVCRAQGALQKVSP
ncbi:hypothetical protein NDU88_001619 [Pleurodeles waltl]|uniref:Uncharacterized protein n=1 Tax=Pleurodeles waltl TaxID=8319 RepID=A0AAV7Q6I5_PLEWA|nr:hypothetical protein NDU88_001619 [Pleurodeles waltl]